MQYLLDNAKLSLSFLMLAFFYNTVVWIKSYFNLIHWMFFFSWRPWKEEEADQEEVETPHSSRHLSESESCRNRCPSSCSDRRIRIQARSYRQDCVYRQSYRHCKGSYRQETFPRRAYLGDYTRGTSPTWRLGRRLVSF